MMQRPGYTIDTGSRQSRLCSLAEAVTNLVAGFLVALVGQQIILPLFGIEVAFSAHVGIAVLFTLLSLLRSYCLRRLFDHVDHLRRLEDQARSERMQQAFERGRP
jgi:hypothetical protein